MEARDENKDAEKPGLISDNDTRKMYGDSDRIHLGNNHSLRMTLSENIVEEGLVLEIKSGLTKHASPEMEFSPQEPYKPPKIARETGAAKVYSSNILMNKSAEAETDSEYEPESDQEHTAEEGNNRHELSPAPVAEEKTGT